MSLTGTGRLVARRDSNPQPAGSIPAVSTFDAPAHEWGVLFHDVEWCPTCGLVRLANKATEETRCD